MKIEDVFFIGGLVFIGYWLTKNNATIIPSEPLDIKPFIDDEKPKTIFLNLNMPKNNKYVMDNVFVKDYNSSMEATFSPQKVNVQSDF